MNAQCYNEQMVYIMEYDSEAKIIKGSFTVLSNSSFKCIILV